MSTKPFFQRKTHLKHFQHSFIVSYPIQLFLLLKELSGLPSSCNTFVILDGKQLIYHIIRHSIMLTCFEHAIDVQSVFTLCLMLVQFQNVDLS